MSLVGPCSNAHGSRCNVTCSGGLLLSGELVCRTGSWTVPTCQAATNVGTSTSDGSSASSIVPAVAAAGGVLLVLVVLALVLIARRRKSQARTQPSAASGLGFATVGSHGSAAQAGLFSNPLWMSRAGVQGAGWCGPRADYASAEDSLYQEAGFGYSDIGPDGTPHALGSPYALASNNEGGHYQIPAAMPGGVYALAGDSDADGYQQPRIGGSGSDAYALATDTSLSHAYDGPEASLYAQAGQGAAGAGYLRPTIAASSAYQGVYHQADGGAYDNPHVLGSHEYASAAYYQVPGAGGEHYQLPLNLQRGYEQPRPGGDSAYALATDMSAQANAQGYTDIVPEDGEEDGSGDYQEKAKSRFYSLSAPQGRESMYDFGSSTDDAPATRPSLNHYSLGEEEAAATNVHLRGGAARAVTDAYAVPMKRKTQKTAAPASSTNHYSFADDCTTDGLAPHESLYSLGNAGEEEDVDTDYSLQAQAAEFSFFHPAATRASAERLLAGKAVGAYLMRMGHSGDLVISYMGLEGKPLHATVSIRGTSLAVNGKHIMAASSSLAQLTPALRTPSVLSVGLTTPVERGAAPPPSWLKGSLSREEAETMLVSKANSLPSPSNVFLVRTSPTGSTVLSVLNRRLTHHFEMSLAADTGVWLVNKVAASVRFHSLPEIISFLLGGGSHPVTDRLDGGIGVPV
jgi:hypothetical protein